MKLCYCAGGNPVYMQAAVDLGWWTGSRSDNRILPVHRPLYLLDIHWKDYDWSAHLAKAAAEQPTLAAVPDIEYADQFDLTIALAEQLAPYCASLLLIPKAHRIIDRLPHTIGGKDVVLGYSVPTRYGGTTVPLWEFWGRPVHLLGGTPRRQIALAGRMQAVSADGNMAQKIAHSGVAFNHRGIGIKDWDDRHGEANMPVRALAHSLTNITGMWRRAGYTIEPRPTE